ncbi:recombination mediator RecR [Imperialibacter roseus]|uniref:Recombination protein RecR n=1 Tax=Imperialibacter roseus TaxID=1324217 RepID=A0ABZ0IML4_9BACT|nr:recombination mediator RecR [Imperialibacter roseus]WOK05693.1 recombination mediator RecR [Imperialibacter roseus]|tara:strand:- start:4366 stop:4986 length:621 start_codon:yes stop_codon:yes gene_type:complete
MEFPSKLIEEAVEQFSQFPGIGKKTALRLVLYLLKQEKDQTTRFTEALDNLRKNIRYCVECHNISDTEVCSICTSHRRERSLICVVEDIHDVLAIENTSQYNGLYHVLGGIISPMNGVGPDELNIQSLVDRIAGKGGEVQEIILALSATMEGDTTSFYITRKVSDKGVKVSTIARGIPFGGELEYTDEITLGRSILTRVNYDLPAS